MDVNVYMYRFVCVYVFIYIHMHVYTYECIFSWEFEIEQYFYLFTLLSSSYVYSTKCWIKYHFLLKLLDHTYTNVYLTNPVCILKLLIMSNNFSMTFGMERPIKAVIQYKWFNYILALNFCMKFFTMSQWLSGFDLC